MDQMNSNIIFIALEKSDYPRLLKQIVDFYKPRYKVPFTEITVENSAIICLALDGDNVIGAVRAISDLSRHALIVDLIVKSEHRRQKIGTKLVLLIVERLNEHKVKNIGLTTEPQNEWLSDFYQSLDFKLLDDSVYLKYEK